MRFVNTVRQHTAVFGINITTVNTAVMLIRRIATDYRRSIYSVCVRIEQELCANEWRPSRLEAECVQGDGLLISFPAIECSPFIGHQLGSYNTCLCAFVPLSTRSCYAWRDVCSLLGGPTLVRRLKLYCCPFIFFSNQLFSAVAQRTPIKSLRQVRS